MKLYLARHGETAKENLQPIDVLSTKGIEKIKRLAEFIKPRELHVSAILHSGKNRAEQTATILSAGFISDEDPKIQTGLQPADDVTQFANTLYEDILVVGHLPFMSRLVSKLLIGNEDHEIVIFEPGTMVCLEERDKDWVMRWMVNPDLVP